jgi:hypothetical protein
MFWHLILVLFSPLYLVFALLSPSDQDRLVVALYQQVLVLQRHVGKRPSPVKGERVLRRNSSTPLGGSRGLVWPLRI